MNKYKAQPTTVDGIKFDSKREAERYGELKLLERAGEIRDLVPHPRFALAVNGFDGQDHHICLYTADFSYFELRTHGRSRRWERIVEDVKNPATARRADYVLRKKLMAAIHGIEIREVF